MQETWVWSPGWEVPLEEGMATHSSILAWRIPWTEEPGGLRSIGLQNQTRLIDFVRRKLIHHLRAFMVPSACNLYRGTFCLSLVPEDWAEVLRASTQTFFIIIIMSPVLFSSSLFGNYVYLFFGLLVTLLKYIKQYLTCSKCLLNICERKEKKKERILLFDNKENAI